MVLKKRIIPYMFCTIITGHLKGAKWSPKIYRKRTWFVHAKWTILGLCDQVKGCEQKKLVQRTVVYRRAWILELLEEGIEIVWRKGPHFHFHLKGIGLELLSMQRSMWFNIGSVRTNRLIVSIANEYNSVRHVKLQYITTYKMWTFHGKFLFYLHKIYKNMLWFYAKILRFK